jgi:hypothetical protein
MLHIQTDLADKSCRQILQTDLAGRSCRQTFLPMELVAVGKDIAALHLQDLQAVSAIMFDHDERA